MNRSALAVFGAALLLAACGGKETTASRSAAALREAQAKGLPVSSGEGHGHHHPEETTSESPMDHSAHMHAEMHHGDTEMHHGDAETHHAMDHGAMSADAHAGLHHGATHTMPMAMPHMDHSQHAGMQHDMSAMPAGAHEHHPSAGAPDIVLSAPTSSAAIARTQPATTLKSDDFDAPAAIAVEEAKKSGVKKEQ